MATRAIGSGFSELDSSDWKEKYLDLQSSSDFTLETLQIESN